MRCTIAEHRYPLRDGHTAYWAGWDAYGALLHPSGTMSACPYADTAWAAKWREGFEDHKRSHGRFTVEELQKNPS